MLKDMDCFQKLVEGDLTHLAKRSFSSHTHDNLSFSERTALNNLKNDDSVAIRNADKGGLVVIMISEAYKNEAQRQLPDSSQGLHQGGTDVPM